MDNIHDLLCLLISNNSLQFNIKITFTFSSPQGFQGEADPSAVGGGQGLRGGARRPTAVRCGAGHHQRGGLPAGPRAGLLRARDHRVSHSDEYEQIYLYSTRHFLYFALAVKTNANDMYMY